MELPIDQVRRELLHLRQGRGLARPSIVLEISQELKGNLISERGSSQGPVHDAAQITTALHEAIEGLNEHERQYVKVDFNLIAEHSFPTLTARQESLADALRCSSKTVRRNADKALESLAFMLATSYRERFNLANSRQAASKDNDSRIASASTWREELLAFWNLSPSYVADIICSELPENELPYFASPQDRNYLRYAKFADLDSLIYVRTHLLQISPDVYVRDFTASEYHGGDAETLVVIGGPAWNAKFKELLPHLPFYFEPHPLGEDDPLVVPILGDLKIGPRWSGGGDLLKDIAVFTRLSMVQGTTIFLVCGCLTLGVLGAAKCFLDRNLGARNARYITELVGEQDFVLVVEARRLGGITDVTDLETSPPILLLARHHDNFKAIINNASQYISREKLR